MLGIFKKSPLKKLQEEYKDLSTRAFNAQRNGDIRSYSMLTAEAEAVREKIEALESEAGS
ncbi:MAG: DUF6435 family protein [Pseudomonadota bacterium]